MEGDTDMTIEQLAIILADAAIAERRAHRDDNTSPKEYWAARIKLRMAMDAYEKAKEVVQS
jgi:hypothetical protein